MFGVVQSGAWKRRLAIAVVPALAGIGLAVVPAAAATTTVVSLTFTDGNSSQFDYARPVLLSHNMKASFYVASGWVDAGSNSSMSALQIRSLYRDGDEIGGMGKDHKSLTDTTTSTAYKQAQVCDDRTRLSQLGVDPQTFAYPQAAVDAAAKQIVQGCGYRAGRTIGGLAATSAPYAEAVPPVDAYNVRTANFPTGAITLATLQTAVNAANSHGGGWLPMSFTQVCHQGASNYSTCMASSKAIDDAVFSQFLDWLGNTGQTGGAPAGVSVNTVRSVMGAPAQPVLAADPTTVSLTFNDGNSTQYKYARPLLQSNHLKASFYVPTNWIDKSFAATMSWWQLDDLYRDGDEIGGMGRDHKDLTDPNTDTAYKTAQVCDDFNRLQTQGYSPQSFDYPGGAYNAAAKSIVSGCGYVGARASGGLTTTGPTYAETLPPKDSLAIRTASTSGTGPLSLSDLQGGVNAAASHGGGWVPLSLTQVCHQGASDYTTCMQSYKPVDDAVLGQFLGWLANAGQAGGAPAGVQVKTVAEALGLPTPPVLAPRPLSVSISFDDSDESQFQTAAMLQQHGMHGTYYVNTAPGHMGLTWQQVQTLADGGNDIGGHTLTHIDMTDPALSFDRKYHEVCDNRSDLVSHGFNPVSFAYPFGSYDDVATGIVRHCGYQSARRAGGIVSDGPTYSETVPPANAFVVRTLFRADTTPFQLSDLTAGVEAAANHGGGWLPLVFHEICYSGTPDYNTCMQSYKPIDSAVFNSFLDWLATSAPTTTSVKDIAEVMGGGNVVPSVSVTTPAVNATVSSSTFSGTASAAGGAVSVAVFSGSYVTDSPLATYSAANNNGSWSTTAPSALADGTYTVQATQTRSGLAGRSVPTTFTVRAAAADTTAPVVAVTAPSNGATVKSATPTVSGTGGQATGDNSTVSVKVYSGATATGTAVQSGSATVVADGSWSTPLTSLADGTYTVQASQSDSAGNTGTSSTVTFTVDTTIPDTTAPVVAVTAPANGATVKSATPTVSGTGGQVAGDISSVTVKIYSGSTATGTAVQSGSATVVADGSWSTPLTSLADGTYTVQASQSDAAGNTGSSSAVTFAVDTTVPDTTAPVVAVTAPADGATLKSATPTVSGTGGQAAGDSSSVTVKVYSGSTATGAAVQTATTSIAADGSWSTGLSSLADGTYTVRASQADSAGNTGTSSAVTFTVDTTVADTTAPVVAVTAPANNATLKSATPTVSGTGGQAAGDSSSVTVKVYSGSTATGAAAQTATPSLAADGTWSTGLSSLADGTYTVQANQSDAAGNTGTSSAVTFTVDTTPADTTAPVVAVTAPADGSTLKSATPTVTGTGGQAATDNASVTVRVYSGSTATGTPVQSATPNLAADGTWSTGLTSLTDGTYTVRASQSDAAGNTGTSSAVSFTVDTTAPKVAITSPAAGAKLTSDTVSVTGTGGAAASDDANVHLNVYTGSTATGTPVQALTTPVTTGSWTTSLTGLVAGTYTLQATQGDSVGNNGSSAAVTVVVGATIASVTPNTLGQGATAQTVKLVGTGFVTGSTATISGLGVAVTQTARTATTITLSVGVDATATPGTRDVTVTRPNGDQGICQGCFTVTAGPKATTVSPSSLKRSTTVAITITGTGFNSTTKVAFSGSDLTNSKLVVVSATKITVSVKVAATAVLGGRSLTLTNSDAGTSTLANALTITT